MLRKKTEIKARDRLEKGPTKVNVWEGLQGGRYWDKD